MIIYVKNVHILTAKSTYRSYNTLLILKAKHISLQKALILTCAVICTGSKWAHTHAPAPSMFLKFYLMPL